jgi:hypothetical protein
VCDLHTLLKFTGLKEILRPSILGSKHVVTLNLVDAQNVCFLVRRGKCENARLEVAVALLDWAADDAVCHLPTRNKCDLVWFSD